jgi:hypothetical protein
VLKPSEQSQFLKAYEEYSFGYYSALERYFLTNDPKELVLRQNFQEKVNALLQHTKKFFPGELINI